VVACRAPGLDKSKFDCALHNLANAEIAGQVRRRIVVTAIEPAQRVRAATANDVEEEGPDATYRRWFRWIIPVHPMEMHPSSASHVAFKRFSASVAATRGELPSFSCGEGQFNPEISPGRKEFLGLGLSPVKRAHEVNRLTGTTGVGVDQFF